MYFPIAFSLEIGMGAVTMEKRGILLHDMTNPLHGETFVQRIFYKEMNL